MDLFISSQVIEPMLKWPGGKQDELDVIVPELPNTINNYFEPFLGGGAVFLTIPAAIPAFVNDKSADLMSLYKMVATQNETFFFTIEFMLEYWKLLEVILEGNADLLVNRYYNIRKNESWELELVDIVDQFVKLNWEALEHQLMRGLPYNIKFYRKSLNRSLRAKLKRMRALEQKKGELSDTDIQNNLEAALKATFYYYARYLYNHSTQLGLSEGEHAAIFFFVRENAYAAMFRYNKKGHFNIPYGGISYNRKNLAAKVDRLRNHLLVERLANTEFGNMDFGDFVTEFPPGPEDFVFLDPPYDSDFSDYDKNPFDQSDQERLAHFLISECKASFMLVIKSTPFIRSLYEGNGLHIQDFSKKYMYTVKSRNVRDTIHLMITNY